MVAVAPNLSTTLRHTLLYMAGTSGNTNRLDFRYSTNEVWLSFFGADTTEAIAKANSDQDNAARVVAVAWSGSAVTAYSSGAAGTPVASDGASSLATTATIGSGLGYNAPVVHRLAIYGSALTAEQLATAAMTTDLLTGLDTSRVTNRVRL
jgi:hypothetical protein